MSTCKLYDLTKTLSAKETMAPGTVRLLQKLGRSICGGPNTVLSDAEARGLLNLARCELIHSPETWRALNFIVQGAPEHSLDERKDTVRLSDCETFITNSPLVRRFLEVTTTA